MEYSIALHSIEDAEDLFLLAKDRLLDVNEWDKIFECGLTFTLTDIHNQKLHRSAHGHDHIRVSNGFEHGFTVSGIIYDDFPDIAGETVTMVIQPEADNADGNAQAIILKRVGKVVAVSGQNFTLVDASFLRAIISTSELVED